MKNHRPLAGPDLLKDSYGYINNSLATALSQSSGTSAPTTNLYTGMPFWNTSTNTLYILISVNPVTWASLVSIQGTSIASLDQKILNMENELANITTSSTTGITSTTTSGTMSMGVLDSNFAYIDTNAPKLKLTKPTEVTGTLVTTGVTTISSNYKNNTTEVFDVTGKIDWNRIHTSSAVVGTNPTRYTTLGSGVLTLSEDYYLEKVLANGIRVVKSTTYTNCNCNCDCDCNCNGA